jgi:hypothetical protein
MIDVAAVTTPAAEELAAATLVAPWDQIDLRVTAGRIVLALR